MPLVLASGFGPPPSYSFWGGNFCCGGDLTCINCTPAQAQAKCGGTPILVETFGTSVTCARTRMAGPPASFIGDFSCCSQLLGPTAFNLTNCYYCPGDDNCVESVLIDPRVPREKKCSFGPGSVMNGTEWTTDKGATVTALLGPCLGCWCEHDTADFDSAVCEEGMSPRPLPAGVDACLGPPSSCLAAGTYSDDCNTLTFTEGNAIAGIPDPLKKLGKVWRRAASHTS